MVGVWFASVQPKAILAGLLAGVGITLLFLLTPLPSKPLGIHAGVWGLAINFLAVWQLHRRAAD